MRSDHGILGLAAILIALALPAAAGEYARLDVSIAAHTPQGTVEVDGLFHLKKILEERSGGAISAAVFYGGTVGSESDLAEQLRTGIMHISLGGFPVMENYAKPFATFIVPYLYTDKAGVLRSWNGRIGEAMRDSYAKNGMYLGGFLLRGNRQLTANTPVQTVADLAGMKIRLPETASWVAVWKELGCIPTPIPASEVFSALQTGVVEAQENPISSNALKGLQEVQKYTIMTNHVVDILTIAYSKRWFDNLNADTQALIRDCVAETVELVNRNAIAQEDSFRQQMEDGGMVFLEVPDIAPFREKALIAAQTIAADWEPWVYEPAIADAAGE
ncbi:MAG: TRAP transporter substrate-binding protein [Planctomycetes bacterium]|nr:TRAP transporter substrate-binding protein [Planctomycetota bacterium]